jgi:NrtR DNA-binding winged helix domain
MPPQFTLLQLQRAVEALAGRLVHKQNFRRLIEQQELVVDPLSRLPRRPVGTSPALVQAPTSRSIAECIIWQIPSMLRPHEEFQLHELLLP